MKERLSSRQPLRAFRLLCKRNKVNIVPFVQNGTLIAMRTQERLRESDPERLDLLKLDEPCELAKRVDKSFHEAYVRDERQAHIARFRNLINTAPRAVCPFLGFRYDTETHASFPTPDNYCHANQAVHSLDRYCQTTYCLTAHFVACERFLHVAEYQVRSGQQRQQYTNGASKPLVVKALKLLFSLK